MTAGKAEVDASRERGHIIVDDEDNEVMMR